MALEAAASDFRSVWLCITTFYDRVYVGKLHGKAISGGIRLQWQPHDTNTLTITITKKTRLWAPEEMVIAIASAHGFSEVFAVPTGRTCRCIVAKAEVADSKRNFGLLQKRMTGWNPIEGLS